MTRLAPSFTYVCMDSGISDSTPKHERGPLLTRLQRIRWVKSGLTPPAHEPILKEKRNYWRKEHARRVGYVIDAAAFYRAVFEAALKAEKQIFIVGWDTDSRVELIVGQDAPGGKPVRLKDFLFELCEARPDLRVYILSWDFTFIYSMEREVLPKLKFEWRGNDQVRFVFDGTHATLGSHHQKIVVIDDRIAFSGGLDITARRWDTPDHFAVDERRIDPWGKYYGPFHDVQVGVEGPAAAALGDLVRERWRLATGEVIAPPIVSGSTDAAYWPPSLAADIENIPVAISRTVPATKLTKPVHEVERLFIDSIAKAKKFILFEAQYFSSKTIARCLARRLAEPKGPEVVMVLPRDATGLIEESTMSVLRGRVLDIVRKADRFNRFRVYHPVVPNLTKGYVKVHSKVTVIDDEFCRIGSANLNQRSMGLDTECDIAFEAQGDEKIRRSISDLRCRLLGEHLGVSPEVVEFRFRSCGSLVETVDALRGKPRTLVPLERRIPEWLDLLVPHREIIDPGGPYRLKRGLQRYFPSIAAAVSHDVPWIGRFKIFSLIVIVAALLLAWEFTPLGEYVKPEKLSQGLQTVQQSPMGPLWVMAAFVVGGFLLIPQTALVLATALTFDPLAACLLAVGGTMASAAATYWVGMKFRSDHISRLSNRWLQKTKDKLAAGGWLAVAVVRLIPVAPFTVVNLVAGSVRVPFDDYFLGTLAGTAPGVIAIAFLADRIDGALKAPDFRSVFLLAVALLAVIAVMKTVKHFLTHRAS